MRKVLVGAMLATVALIPSFALATTVDSSLVPDGTYVVKIEKVQDAQHALVLMDNGVETTLVAMGSVDFSKVKANQTIKISLRKGAVSVYMVQ